MILEIVGCTIMGGLLSYTFLDKNGTSEASKIQRVANNCGLKIKEGTDTRTIHLLRRKRYPWGVEYVYRIPLGLSFDDFQKKKQHFEDGLNHKRGWLDIGMNEIRSLRIRGDIIKQIKELLNDKKHRKEIIMDYDGTLKIIVYNEPIKEFVPYDEDTLKSCTGWMICIGESREGTIYHDFDKIPHMVVAGTTTYGKSVFLKNCITTLIHTHHKDVKFTLLDLKGGLAMNRFANTKQVNVVATDTDESLAALEEIVKEMKQRQRDFRRNGHENIREARMKERHFIIIDEAAELASQGEADRELKTKKIKCERIISEIARIGGSLGYRLIFATQYPTGDTLPRQVKQNCDAKLCFRLQTEIGSHVVLDESGAEKLPRGLKGRAIYLTDQKQIVQTPFIENDFIDKTIKPHIVIKARKEEPYVKAIEPRGSDTLVIEEVGLSHSKSNTKIARSRKRA